MKYESKELALEEILRHGITRAMMSVEFFSSVIERVKEPEGRELLERILQQESNSVQQLVELLERVRRLRAGKTATPE